jgi:hypothetical protein
MTQNTWLGFLFFVFAILITLRKQLAWLVWKWLRLRTKEQIFDLLSKHAFIEIKGPSKGGKSWLLFHAFVNLQAVKLTNTPTPNSIYTLNPETLQAHMVGKWGVPHKYYYFLDDLNTFQIWVKNKLGDKGYIDLRNYVARAGKSGANFIWTNNGASIDPCFADNKNTTWTVQRYFSFSKDRYSLLMVKTGDNWHNILPTIIAIDNQEIKSYYDKFWNTPREIHENTLNYISEGMDAKELDGIMKVIEDTNGNLDFSNETVKLLKEYIDFKKAELRGVNADKAKNDKFKKEVKFFGLNPNKKLTFKDIERLKKDEKLKRILKKDEGNEADDENKNKNKPNKFKKANKAQQNNPDLIDLDQVKQNLAADE